MSTIALDRSDRLPRPTLVPLLRLVDRVGLIEHADRHRPDPRLGHCTDDAGRALGLSAELHDDLAAEVLSHVCLAQLQASRSGDGFHLRLDEHGNPTNHPRSDDATARAIWGLALASVDGPDEVVRCGSSDLLEGLHRFWSPFPRAAAHAVVAAAVLIDGGLESIGEQILVANVPYVPRPGRGDRWPWPEATLSYTNALLPEALLRAGQMLDNPDLVADGLRLLEWLVTNETSPEGHLSFTPVDRGVPSPHPAFDQQPVEAWALACASLAAFEITGDDRWGGIVENAERWFAGHNDVGIPMWDDQNGSAFDGLTANGVNLNQGAESSIAFVGTLVAAQKVRRRRAQRAMHPSQYQLVASPRT